MALRRIGLGFAFAAITVAGAYAHTGAMGQTKIRMDAMKSISDSMKAISGMLRGGTEIDVSVMAEHARSIAGHAEKYPVHFSDPKIDAVSEAAPAIWERPAEFEAISADLAAFARGFETRALEGADVETLMADFRQMGATCNACHEDFRIKKN